MVSSSSAKDRDLKQNLTIAAKIVETISKPIINGIVILLPIVITKTKYSYNVFMKLPQNCLHFIYGSVFCFFGGTYPTLFAAIQAAEYGGRQKFISAVSDLSNEAIIIINESKKEDDENTNAIANETNTEYLTRKTKLVLRKMNPDKVDQAISSIYTVWISVVAVLSVEFAKTISMSLAIADFLKKPMNRFITPTIQLIVPNEYDKWVPIVISWMTKSIAMSVAWYIQTVVSAFSSALKGGLMMGQATYRFCLHRNMKVFGWMKPKEEESTFDEALAYIFAALGFYVQYSSGFQLPAPLNFILWPFGITEYYIKWSITKKKE